MDLKEYFRNRDMIGVQEDDEGFNPSLACITIDKNVIGGYGSYSFVRVVEYVSEPQRSSDGKISNLDGYTTFITPKVKLHFNAISIDGYRKLMNLITSKREFDVGCWDFNSADETHPDGRWVHQNMYFYPNDYPEIFQYDLQVLAVMNFDIELIGTNTNNENIVVNLHSNYPETADSEQSIYTIANAFKNQDTLVKYPSNFSANKEVTVNNVVYTFDHWNTKADGTGYTYFDDNELAFLDDTDLYAIWTSGRVRVKFLLSLAQVSGGGIMKSYIDMYEGDRFSDKNTPQYEVEPSQQFDGWYKASNREESIYGLLPNELTYLANEQCYVAYGAITAA